MNTKIISLTAVYASLYAVLVIFLAPISLGPIQLRVADCLLPLVTLFGWPVILGATLGCFVGNIFGGIIVFGSFNLIDVVLGSTANFVASLAIFTLRRKRFLSCIVGSILIGVIVGGYLWLFFSPPDIFGLSIQPWIAMIISLTLSSLIVIAGIGYILLLALSQPNIIGPIRAKGLKVYL